MKAIILAAGYGNRMRPLTDEIHKTLIKISEKTIIQRIIDGLRENSIFDIVIVTGYKADELKNYLLKEFHDINFEFIHNSRYRETNNIYSLALAFDSIIIDDDIVLIESDLIYEPQVIKRIINSKYKNVALIDKYASGMDGTVVNVRDEVITDVIPPHLQHSKFDFSDKYKTLNIYKFSKEFCNNEFKKILTYYAKVIDDNCYYELILGILIYMQRETIYAEIINGEKWAEVDDPNDLRIADFIFNKHKRRGILDKSYGGFWAYNVLDFCFIRNMYFPNSSLISEMRNNLPDLMHNYGSCQAILNEKIAYFLLCKRENINVLNGASQVYPFLKNYFLNSKILLPNPTFGEYNGKFPNSEYYFDMVGIDPQEIQKKAGNADVIVIVNPNNPTGSTVQTEWIYNFAASNPKKYLIIDESFIEFSGLRSMVELLEKNPLDNIIVIKSLSKSLGVPGLRLGYAYSCNEQFNKALAESLPIWNLNSMAEFLLEIILKHRKSLEKSYQDTIRDREEFMKKLKNNRLIERVYSSGANFVLASVNSQISMGQDIVNQMLMKHAIYIKDVSKKFNDNKLYFRFAIRYPDENNLLLACLEDVIDQTS